MRGERAGSAWDNPVCDPVQDMIDAFWRPEGEFTPFPQRHLNRFVGEMTGLSQEEIKNRAGGQEAEYKRRVLGEFIC